VEADQGIHDMVRGLQMTNQMCHHIQHRL